MDEQIIPPSPNWYANKIISTSTRGSIAYATRNNIILFENPGSRLKTIKTIRDAHKEKVSAVVFCRSNTDDTYSNCLVSIGNDSLVKLWDMTQCMAAMVHDCHDISKISQIVPDSKLSPRSGRIACVDWSPANPNLVVSAEETVIVCWNLKTNTTRYIKAGKLNPTCIACSWHEPTIAAFGAKGGLVCILDLKDEGKILYRMRGHSTDVVSLSWCPVSYNVCNRNKDNRDMLLASGGKDREVYIWRAGGDGRYEVVLNVPEQPPAGQHRRNSSSQVVACGSVSWVAVCWVTEEVLLTSSIWGELLSWNVRKAAECMRGGGDCQRKKLWKVIHSNHLRGLFSIACLPCVEDSTGNTTSEEGTLDSKKCEKSHIVWTTAQDRHLVGADFHSERVLFDIPTFGGNVYCLAVSPLDSNRIAIGAGDAAIRIWNLSNRNKIDFATFWQKINSKVTALAWHPIQEDLLAYGTGEGRVGILNVATGAPPTVLKLHHRRTVYSLSWGMCLSQGVENDGRNLLLYSCGDEEVVIYNPRKPESDPVFLNRVVKQSTDSQNKFKRTEVAWNSECNMLAVGNADGSLQVWAVPELIEKRLYPYRKAVQCLAWHPVSTFTDAQFSVCRNWLAVSGNETNIKVFDMSNLIEGDGQADCKPVAVLTGHYSRVVSISWSPHISGQLVSASYDGTAQVWDVRNQEPVANFPAHTDAVLSCIWSPLDPEYIISGSLDCSIKVWKISDQTEKLPTDKKKNRRQLRLQLEHEKSLLEPTAGDKLVEDGADVEEMKIAEVGAEYAVSEKASNAKLDNKTTKVLLRKSHFPIFSEIRNKGRMNDLARIQRNLQEGDTEPTYFGSREALMRLIDAEEEHHFQMGNHELIHEMELWRGNITEVLKTASETNTLTDWLVSISPVVSQRVWKDTIESYVRQLTETGHFIKAASYLLAVHKVNEAVELLISKKFFREALCIAKCRLSEDDPIIKKVLHAWADHLIIGGNNEHAAECLVATNDRKRMKEAIKILSKKPDPEVLWLASDIARKANDNGLADSYIKKSLCEFLLQEKWDNALKMLNHGLNENLYLKYLVITHKNLITMRNSFETLPTDIVWGWLQGQFIDSLPLIQKMEASWIEYFGSNSFDKGEGEYILENDFSVPSTSNQLWLTVSELVFAACISTEKKRLQHLIQALASCYQFGIANPTDTSLLKVMLWLVPRGPLQDELLNISQADSFSPLVKSIRCYVVAEICRWLENVSVWPEVKTLPSEELREKHDDNSKSGNISKTVSVVHEPNRSTDTIEKEYGKSKSENNTKTEVSLVHEPNRSTDTVEEEEEKRKCEGILNNDLSIFQEPNRNMDIILVNKELTENGISEEVSEVTKSTKNDAQSVSKSSSGKDSESVNVMQDMTGKVTKEKKCEENDLQHTEINSATRNGLSEDLESLNVTKELIEKESETIASKCDSTDCQTVSFSPDNCKEFKADLDLKKDLIQGRNSEKNGTVTQLNNTSGLNDSRDKQLQQTQNNGHCSENGKKLENTNIADENFKFLCISEILKQFSLDVVDLSPIKYFKDQLEIKKLEHELANFIARSNKENSSLSEEFQKNQALLIKLNNVKESVELFEIQRVNSPNPFITYCKLMNVCQFIVDRLPSIGNELMKNIKTSWESKINSL